MSLIVYLQSSLFTWSGTDTDKSNQTDKFSNNKKCHLGGHFITMYKLLNILTSNNWDVYI